MYIYTVLFHIHILLAIHRISQLGSPVVSLSISCSSENCADALKKDGVQITIVHNIQVC